LQTIFNFDKISGMFKIVSKIGRARRGKFTTARGVIETPVFMNVATQASIKGGLSAFDLRDAKCQVALANTYHLHIRPGDDLIHSLGGLHRFMAWDGPILTDSGGFQIFSLAKLRKISEAGVAFSSHVDGRKIFMSPEDSIRIQLNLGSDIIMAFDECIELPAPHDYVISSCERTRRWLLRCKEELERQGDGSSVLPMNAVSSTGQKNRPPVLFGINQGGTFADLRISHMKSIAELDLPGYAIGGLAVGESTQEMYDTVEIVEEHMPADKPRYLMGVGTPQNIIEAVSRGVDFFDCVMPARNGRHGKLYVWGDGGSININNERFRNDDSPIDASCECHVCANFSRAYLRHLFKSGEILGMRLAVMHNLFYYNTLMAKIRDAIDKGTFPKLSEEFNQ